MLSGIIERILLKFLGEYIDGIKNSMDVALLKGKIKIQNVSLKNDFFNNLSLPLRLAYSKVQSIKIHIPWSSLKKESTTVQVDGIYALFYVNYELKDYKFDVQERFQQMVDKATQMIKMKFQQKEREGDSIIEKYIIRILDNVKVKVKNIHVRLQSLQRKWDFSIGILINKIRVFTVNSQGQKTFFKRQKHHHLTQRLHRKSNHPQNEVLQKKVQVQNIEIYFTQKQTQFLTLLDNKQVVLQGLKSYLNFRQQLKNPISEKQVTPQLVLRLKLQAVLKMQLNEKSKYDVDTKVAIEPIVTQLTDRMAAELFYFLQFTFEWQMRKYKALNKNQFTKSQLVDFYKLMLINVAEGNLIDKEDYKAMLRVIQKWSYDFLVNTTVEFMKQQKIKKQLNRRRNHKILQDVVRMEQFKKEIEQKLFTDEQTKKIYEIIQNVTVFIQIPSMALVLLNSPYQQGNKTLLHHNKRQQVLSLGLQDINVAYNTIFTKQTALAVSVRQLAFNPFLNSQGNIRPSNQFIKPPLIQPFLSLVFTKSHTQFIQSCSITLSKRIIHIQASLISNLFTWVSAIRLRPAIVNFINQIFSSYVTELIKKILQMLFKEYRVISLQLHLPTIQVLLNEERDMLTLDLGMIQGKNVSDKLFSLQLKQRVKCSINQHSILQVYEGMFMEIVDKAKVSGISPKVGIQDREKITWVVKAIKIQNADKVVDFLITMIGSQIIQQFLKLDIVENPSAILQGNFYLNRSPHRQKILLKSDKLYFLPSKYKISLQKCKIYQMHTQNNNYLVFHSLQNDKTDTVLVQNQNAMETIFYNIRQKIHENSTAEEWDMYYKQNYPIQIGALENLKSKKGENYPLFTFFINIEHVIVPLGSYLDKQEENQRNQGVSLQFSKQKNLMQFFQNNDKPLYDRQSSKLQVSNISLRIDCFQLNTAYIFQVSDTKLVIQNESIFKNFSVSVHCSNVLYYSLRVMINSFQLVVYNKEVLKKILEIAMLFQRKIEQIVKAADEFDLMNCVQAITKQHQQISMFTSSASLLPQSQHSHYLSMDTSSNSKQHSLLDNESFISLLIVLQMTNSKINILNYITDIKNLKTQVQVYRTQYFPSVKLQISDLIIFSSLQVINLELKLNQNFTQPFKYAFEINIDRIVSYQNIQCIFLDVAEGEINHLIVELLYHLKRKKQAVGKAVINKKYKPSSFKDVQTHPKFNLNKFLDPIKSIRKTQSKDSMKSLRQQLLLEKQVYIFVFDCLIKSVSVQIFFHENMPTLTLEAQNISLKQNELNVKGIKLDFSGKQMLNCKNIMITLPRINQACFQQQYKTRNYSRGLKFNDFQFAHDLKKEPFQYKRGFLPAKMREEQEQITLIKVETLSVEVKMEVVGQVAFRVKQMKMNFNNSKQYLQTKQKIKQFIEQNTRAIGKIPKKMQQVNELTQVVQRRIKHQVPYDVKWIVDASKLTQNIQLKTINPVNITLYSMQGKQLITCSISADINYPSIQTQNLAVTLNHYNHLIQLYEPIIEPIRVQLSHTKQHESQQNFFKIEIPDLKMIVTEEIIIDVCNELHIIKKVAQKAQINKYQRLTLDELEFRKMKLYEKYREFSLIGQTLKDLQSKQQNLAFGEQPLTDIIKNVKGIFSMSEANSTKIYVQNFTWCQILCQLTQSQFTKQQIHTPDYSTSQIHSSFISRQYFIIPYKKTHKQYTTPHQYLKRQVPMKMKICFIEQRYAISPIILDLLLQNISTAGERRQFFKIEYEDFQGEKHETILQVYFTYDYMKQNIRMQIKPKFQMINQTMVDLRVFSCNKDLNCHKKQQKFKSPIHISSSIYLPFWLQQQIGLQIKGYQSKQSNKMFTVPLATQQNFLQNYPKQNYLLSKQQFVHNFEVKLGQQYCIIPLLIVKLKKYEKYLDNQSEQQKFRQVKCKVLIMPLATVANHLPSDIFINSQKYAESSSSAKTIPFFLSSQFTSQIQSILFSFPSGQKYHIDLSSSLYVPKQISVPYKTNIQSCEQQQQQISFNLLCCRNQFGQMILHFYPILQVIMKVPIANTLKYTMLTRVDYQDKARDVVCASITIKKEHDLVTQQTKKIHYLLSQNDHKIKFNLRLLKDFSLLTTQQQQNFTQTNESKRSPGYINLQQLMESSQNQQSSSSGSSSQSIYTAQQLSRQQSQSSTGVSTYSASHHLINLPTLTPQNQLIYFPYLLNVTKKRVRIQQEQSTSVYDINGIKEFSNNKDENKKYEEFYSFTLLPYNSIKIKDQIIHKAKKLTKKIGKKLIKQMPQIKASMKDKISSVLLTFSVPNINFSLVIRNSSENKIMSQLNFKRRHELINVQVKGYEMVARFFENDQQFDGLSNQQYSKNSIQIEHTINKLLVNSIDCQKTFKDSILRMNENKTLNILMAFTNKKTGFNKANLSKKQQHSLKQSDNLNLKPQIRLTKLFLRFSDQKMKLEESNDNHHFFISFTDTLALQFMNWLISLHPFISPLIMKPNQALIKKVQLPPAQSLSIADRLQKLQGLILSQQIIIKLSFSSLGKKSHQHISKFKKLKKQTQSMQFQSFLQQLCQLNLSKASVKQQMTSQQLYAYQQSRTIRRIFKYLKKIPFSILEVQRARLVVPQIKINGKLSQQDANEFQTALLVNISTGIIKGMKLIGSPSSFMEYVQKSKKIKNNQKLSYFLERVAKGGINSVTGILKAFSSGISQLTFDQQYLQQRQNAMEDAIQGEEVKNKTQENQSPGQQGIDAFILGVKKGITGLVEQPVQNYKRQGTQGIFIGSLKGLTGLFTKPLTGILDLGTKTLQSIKGKKNNPIMNQQHFLNISLTYCRPLFHQSSIIRPFTSAQHLCYLILKSFIYNKSPNQNISFICCYELKQNPFWYQSQEYDKQNLEDIKHNKQFVQNSKIFLAVCHQMSYVIQLSLVAALSSQKGLAKNILSKQIIHSRVKIVGKEENGVCLVFKQNQFSQNNNDSPMKGNNDSEMSEICITPSKHQQREPMYLTYKNLIKFNGVVKKKV